MIFDTERCLVRPFREQDLDAFMRYRNDLEWMRYQGFKGLTRQAYRDALLAGPGLMAGIQLAIVEKRTQALIGDIYLRQEGSAFWIGYTISPAYARQGFATEVVTAAIATLQARGVARILADVDAGNAASVALLHKLGFTLDSTVNGESTFSLELQE